MPQTELNTDFMKRANPENWYEIVGEAMSECTRILCLPEKTDEALILVLKCLCTILSGRRAYLYQLNKNGWTLLHEWCPSQQDFPYLVEEVWSCSQESAWQGAEPLLLNDLEPLREASTSFYELLYANGVTSTAVVPLVTKGKTIGCLGVENPAPDVLGKAGPLLCTLAHSILSARGWEQNKLGLEHLRLYDGLTGVLRRSSYLRELQEIQLEQEALGIIRFQLFDMKRMNECFGYAYGDEFLVRCIQQVSKTVENQGKLYRMGCDEFAVICTGLDREHFEKLATRLSPELEQAVQCRIAVGYQWTAQPRNMHRLDLAAESMMEADKQRFIRLQEIVNNQRFIEEDIYGMLTMEGVTSFLADGRFIIYLQPKLSFRDGSLVGAEALVRFLDSKGAIVEPGRFLPDLESSMLIKHVDFYVFEQACRLIRSWINREAHKYTPVSVNFSKMTIAEPNLVSKMLHLCRKYDVEPCFLEMEITGGLDRQQSGELSRLVDKIRAAGFVISVDDFGIRFANLSLLIALDCDKLKVDKSLIENVTTSSKAQSVLRALAALCIATGTKTTIEGIETEAQLSMLKSMGFDEMQGYLISQPLSTDEFREKYL